VPKVARPYHIVPKADPKLTEGWHGPCQYWHSRVRFLALNNPKFYLLLPSFYHKHLSSSKLLSKTSITNNFQTIRSPSKLNQFTKFLHQNTSKHRPNHNLSIKNNFHTPKPKFTKFEFLHTLTQKPQILHQTPQPNSKTLLKP